jgi:GT2 family glycosyltransferase
VRSLGIVIPTLGQPISLPRVLGRLGPEVPVEEILVVVDASTQTPPWLTLRGEADPRLSVLRAERAGASAARNAGWRRAVGDVVLFLDDDIVPTDRLVAEHREWHVRHPEPEVGVLGAVRWSPEVQVTPFMRWLETGVQFDYDAITGVEVSWTRFYSCNVSVKRRLLERVGGFDAEAFPFGHEDLDLGRRLHDAGSRLLYNRAAVGEHLKTETLKSWAAKLPRIAASERRFVARYPDMAPYFYDRFRAAAAAAPARGRSARLARWIPRTFPVLGTLVWRSCDIMYSQHLAPEYMRQWEAAAGQLVPSEP